MGPRPARAELLEVAYRDLERFVAWLRATGVAVPACWYVHRWSAHRLAVVMHWRSELTGCGRPARDAAEWWGSIWGLQGLRDAWTREGLFDYGEKHFESGREEPRPSLATVVERHVEEARLRATWQSTGGDPATIGAATLRHGPRRSGSSSRGPRGRGETVPSLLGDLSGSTIGRYAARAPDVAFSSGRAHEGLRF